jgi:hypothetical protein
MMAAQAARQISRDELPEDPATSRRFLFAVPTPRRDLEPLKLRSHWEYDQVSGRLIQVWRREP